MSFGQVLLCLSTFMLLVSIWIIGDPRQLSALNEEVAVLKLQIAKENEQRAVFETKLSELKNELQTTRNALRGEFDVFREEVVVKSKRQQVAFSARLAKSYDNIEPWATIVFSDVETNIGNAYDGVNGKFTAQIEGVYVFYSHILSWLDKIIETCLQVNGVNKMHLYSGGKYLGSGSNGIVIHLKAGDKVKMVKHGPFGTKPFYIHHGWSTFSGFLI